MNRGRVSRWVRGAVLGLVALALGLIWAEGGLRLKPSTRRLWRVAREAGRPWWRFVHTYVYARWPTGYIGSAIGERGRLRALRPVFAPFLWQTWLPRDWANGYHGKVIPIQDAKRLVSVREDVQAVVPEQVIPFHSARDLILSHPDHIVALDCPCREGRVHPCQPMDVCLVVGEPFVGFVLEHHPHKARAITSDEAIAILEAEARRGHVHHAFFKEAMLDRFYAICNCCSCCCGAMSAQRHGIPMLISSGYVAQVDISKCRGCGLCGRMCPFHAIALTSYASIDAQACMGCGVCALACPTHALALRREATKPAPLEIPPSVVGQS